MAGNASILQSDWWNRLAREQVEAFNRDVACFTETPEGFEPIDFTEEEPAQPSRPSTIDWGGRSIPMKWRKSLATSHTENANRAFQRDDGIFLWPFLPRRE